MKFSDLKMPKSKKTPQLLLERPPPPSVKQLIEDMKNAPGDDIAFRHEKNDNKLGLSHADLSEFTMASATGDDDDEDDLLATALDDDNTEINETYNKVEELINLTDKLHRAPEELRTLQRAMNEAAARLDESVQTLTQTAAASSSQFQPSSSSS